MLPKTARVPVSFDMASFYFYEYQIFTTEAASILENIDINKISIGILSTPTMGKI